MIESVWSFINSQRMLLIGGAIFYFAGIAIVYKQLPERSQHFDVDSGGYHKAQEHIFWGYCV